jgi:hypothetical protein
MEMDFGSSMGRKGNPPMADIHSVEVQRRLSFEAGWAVGLCEAAINVLDDLRLPLNGRFRAATRLMAMIPLMATYLAGGSEKSLAGGSEKSDFCTPPVESPATEVTEDDVAKLRNTAIVTLSNNGLPAVALMFTLGCEGPVAGDEHEGMRVLFAAQTPESLRSQSGTGWCGAHRGPSPRAGEGQGRKGGTRRK